MELAWLDCPHTRQTSVHIADFCVWIQQPSKPGCDLLSVILRTIQRMYLDRRTWHVPGKTDQRQEDLMFYFLLGMVLGAAVVVWLLIMEEQSDDSV